MNNALLSELWSNERESTNPQDNPEQYPNKAKHLTVWPPVEEHHVLVMLHWRNQPTIS